MYPSTPHPIPKYVLIYRLWEGETSKVFTKVIEAHSLVGAIATLGVTDEGFELVNYFCEPYHTISAPQPHYFDS